MALSVDSATSLVVNPQYYSLNNQSQVSTAYEQSMQVGGVSGAAAVKGAHPVQYPNANVYEAQATQRQEAVAMESAYNAIATSFDGATTAYSSSLAASSYASVGAGFDAYA